MLNPREKREENERVEKQKMFLDSLSDVRHQIESQDKVFPKLEITYNATKQIPKSNETYRATFDLWKDVFTEVRGQIDQSSYTYRILGDIIQAEDKDEITKEKNYLKKAPKKYENRIEKLGKLIKSIRDEMIMKNRDILAQNIEEEISTKKEEKKIIEEIKATLEENYLPPEHLDLLNMTKQYEQETKEGRDETNYGEWKDWIEQQKDREE